MTNDELIEKLVKNVLMYGTGFTKLSMNQQGQLEISVVPIEDYMYIEGKKDEAL